MLEICCFSVCAAVHAVLFGGARRIEFCANRELDGISPTAEDVTALLRFNALRNPSERFELFVMVREPPPPPSECGGGDVFVLDHAADQLDRLVRYVRELPRVVDPFDETSSVGVDGVVFGAIRLRQSSHCEKDGGNRTGTGEGVGLFEVDEDAVLAIATAAAESGIPGFTFHRAFDWIGIDRSVESSSLCDETVDSTVLRMTCLTAAVAALRRCGVTRVLTSGKPGHPAIQSAALLVQLQREANAARPDHDQSDACVRCSPFHVMCGGGVSPHVIRMIQQIAADHCHDGSPPVLDFHGSFLQSVADAKLCASPVVGCPCPLHRGPDSHVCDIAPNATSIREAAALCR